MSFQDVTNMTEDDAFKAFKSVDKTEEGEYDKAFTPILSSNDKGESPKNGALLIAPYGKGHYIYTGLSFFRELPEGVTGAYKLLSNIISLQPSETIPAQKIKP